jgi:sterol desaturase/sphingolipid hydroxylase (fatty acid hydroxylase superfamily)
LAAGALFILVEHGSAQQLLHRGATYLAAHWRSALFGASGRMILLLAAVMIMELFVLRWDKTSICSLFVRRSASATADAAWTVLYFSQLQFFVELALTFGVAFGIAKLTTSIYAHIGWQQLTLPFHGPVAMVVTFIVFYLGSTFVSYWVHRVQHWRHFWRLHRYHHAATELNVLTGFRNNPVESITNALALPTPLVLLHMDNWTIAALVLGYQAISVLQHTELPWSFGWFGRWIIVSPKMHQIHHSIDEEHRDRNFSVCPLWDHLFGTWYTGTLLPSAYGIPDPAHVNRPILQWLIDIGAFYRDAVLWLIGLVSHRSRKATAPSPATQ